MLWVVLNDERVFLTSHPGPKLGINSMKMLKLSGPRVLHKNSVLGYRAHPVLWPQNVKATRPLTSPLGGVALSTTNTILPSIIMEILSLKIFKNITNGPGHTLAREQIWVLSVRCTIISPGGQSAGLGNNYMRQQTHFRNRTFVFYATKNFLWTFSQSLFFLALFPTASSSSYPQHPPLHQQPLPLGQDIHPVIISFFVFLATTFTT